ncbi:MAG: M48 family metallopeptidase [Candidatus Hydrogenedentes bacterium]|nr:M48 family metallopeptidase [Candidatus Hydrogenedentota bacterium]
MIAWHGSHARQILESRLTFYLPRFYLRGAPEPQVRYRRMKKRWGSCSRNGIIMLNTELGRTPLDCIDYVVVHELCHLLHPCHNRGFFHLLKTVLPDWERRKDRLEKALL